MQSLVINNYKNFENLTLGNLANVNLIVGKNNVGKSTLLEARSMSTGLKNYWRYVEKVFVFLPEKII